MSAQPPNECRTPEDFAAGFRQDRVDLWLLGADPDKPVTRAALAAAGYHVVQEGQAVVDGSELCSIEQITRHKWEDGSHSYVATLRPLTEPPPVVDEMTTTTQIPEASE